MRIFSGCAWRYNLDAWKHVSDNPAQFNNLKYQLEPGLV